MECTIVRHIGRHEEGNDDNADDGGVDSTLGADCGTFQWKTHGDEPLEREQQHQVAGTDLTARLNPPKQLASGLVVLQ